MKNLITVKMDFGYRGEEFVFESVEELPLHLDGLLEFAGSIPRRMARANGIDAYSYMFESMECTPIEVVKAEGYVSRFMQGDSMPLGDFMAECSKVTFETLLEDVAVRMSSKAEDALSVEEALLLAYNIGFSKGSE